MFRRVLSIFFPSGANQSQQSQPGTPVDQPVTSPSSPHQSQETQPGTPVDQPGISPSSPHQSQQTQPGTPVDQPVTFPSNPNQSQQTQQGPPVDQPGISPSDPHQSQQTQPGTPVDQPVTSPSDPHQSQQTQPSAPVDQPVTSPSNPHQSQQTQPGTPVDKPVTSPSSPHQSQQTQPSVVTSPSNPHQSQQTQPGTLVDQPVTSPSNPHQSQQTQPSETQVLCESIFQDLATRIGNKWTELAIHLGFRDAEMEHLQADYPRSQQQQTFQMLKTWWQRWDHLHDNRGIGALDALCDALREIGRNDLVNFVTGSVEGAGNFDPDPYRNEFIRYYQDEMSVVPLLPWLPSNVRSINDIYVKLKLQERLDKGRKVKKQDIDSHEDMLNLKYEDGKPVRFILLSGIAGSGKTTIVSKMATDWAEQKPGSPLSKFTFLVALNMRELKGVSDLTGAIYHQILAEDTKLSRQSLTYYLSLHAEKVLVVLDGADEYDKEGSQLPSEGFINKIIRSKILRGCTVLVTTRPHMVAKLYEVNPSFIHIETRGFSDEGVKTYIQKFFKGEDLKMPVGLFGYLKASRTLLSLARTPIMLLLMCFVWSDEQKLPETLTELFLEALVFILKRHFEKFGLPNPEDKELLDNEVIKLVKALGGKALDGLMLPGQKLVFEAGDFGYPEAVDKACKIGILSKEKIRSRLRAVERVTFFLKSFQDAIAGFYWASLVESDEKLFVSYLNKVDKSNALGMEYLMRFCCGSNARAAESLLRYVETFGMKTEVMDISDDVYRFQDSNEPFRRLWILMYFEAHSEELHSIAETIFNHVFLVKMNCGNDFTSALKFLVECATSSGQSLLTKMKQVLIQDVRLKEETSVAATILRCSPEVTDVFISTVGKNNEVLNEACLGEALSRMQSLEKLEIDGIKSDSNVKVYVILNHLSKSRSLKTLKLSWCEINCRDWVRFIMYSQLRELVLHSVPLQDISPQELTDIPIQTTNLETLKIKDNLGTCRILRLVRSYPNLKSLKLEDLVLLSEDHIKSLRILLSTAPKLRVVELAMVSLCRDFFPNLAEQLKSLKELNELKLSFVDGLCSQDIIILAKDVLPSLCNLRVLEVIFLTKTSVDPEAFLAVMRWVCASPSMYELTLSRRESMLVSQLDNKSEPVSIDAVDAIHQPTQGSLQKLKVRGISLGPCKAAFNELLKQMPLLKRLEMEDIISFEESDWTDLVEVLKGCQQLQELNLRDNVMTSRALEDVLRLIPRLPNLQWLTLPEASGEPTQMVQDCFQCGRSEAHFLGSIFRYCTLNKSEIAALVGVVEQYSQPRASFKS